jgi:hypothetical protein
MQFVRAINARTKGTRVRQERQRAEKRDVNKAVDFRAGIMLALKEVRVLLEQLDVSSVSIEVDEDQLLLFNEALYSHEFAGYDITQDPTQANRFKIADKVLF